MPTYMMETGNYAGILTANAGLENMLYFSQYRSLESQLDTIHFLQEPDDPPETLHTPWGIWRHYRDALHRIDEMLDAEHVIRKSRPAEDILHEAHYVPTIGDPGHKEGSYGMKLEYDAAELEVYNSKINLREYHAEMGFGEEMESENATISVNTETDDFIDSKNKDVEGIEEQNSSETQKKNISLEDEKELTKIFEKHIKNSAESGGV